MLLAADAPNVADWIAAIGQAAGALFTAGAVGIAVWLGWRDRNWRRADLAAATAERDDRDAAQARLITITHDRKANDIVRVTVRNESALPIFDVRNDEVENERIAGQWEWGYDFAGMEQMGGYKISTTVLSAGETVCNAGIFARLDGSQCDMSPWDQIRATVRFTDANGLRWSRRDTEAPIRIIDRRGDGGGPAG